MGKNIGKDCNLQEINIQNIQRTHDATSVKQTKQFKNGQKSSPSLCYEDYRGESAKTEACLELLREAIDGGHKVLLFSQFTSLLDLLRERLDREGIAFYELRGSTSKEQRATMADAFNRDDTPVFLISLKAGGTGLNLTGADVVIHFDPWWNLSVQNQATDRAHRIGQTRAVQVYKLIARDTVEEKILHMQERKQALADTVIHEGEGLLSGMTADELLTGIVHNRLGRVLTRAAGLRDQARISDLDDAALNTVCSIVKSFELKLTEPMGMDSAQVTAGGIVTDDFNPETMESKRIPGLYACGEVLDIDGDCGGYNLQWAWSSGRLAGLSARKEA